jgi:hypothetical protein
VVRDSQGSDSNTTQQNIRPTFLRSRRTEESGGNTGILLCLKLGIGVVFFFLVLSSSVLSKLTLVSLTNSLRYHTWVYQNKSILSPNLISENERENWRLQHEDDTVSLYWQLLLILLVPNCLTFLRCLFFGLLGKTKMTYPWPVGKAMLLVC